MQGSGRNYSAYHQIKAKDDGRKPIGNRYWIAQDGIHGDGERNEGASKGNRKKMAIYAFLAPAPSARWHD